MKFELEFEEINFILELAVETNYIPCDRFDKISTNILSALKKNELNAYSLTISSNKNKDQMTFYKSGIILTSNKDELLEDVQDYLEGEDIIENICESWKKFYLEDGPIWKVK